MGTKKIIVAISGASGAIYASQLLESLAKYSSQYAHLAVVFSETAKSIWKHELNTDIPEQDGFTSYNVNDFYASFASGSSRYQCMIVCPCSMGMLGRIAAGISDDLIARAADVMLKERRKLILVPREAPYNLIHLQNMEKVTLAGGIVCPASPSFYGKPHSVEQMVQTIVDRVLDLAGFDIDTDRWGEL